MVKRVISLAIGLMAFVILPLGALAAGETEAGIAYHEAADSVSMGKKDEDWLRETFPKLRSTETTQTRFVFAPAPEVTKTCAVLNKKGESLTIYRFDTAGALETCKAMIQGIALVYGGKTVYADTRFPVTYYYNGAENTIALYCGADKNVNNKLSGYTIAGNFGGYFQSRNMIAVGDYIYLDIAKWDEGYLEPNSIERVLKLADIVCIGKVKKAPSIPEKGEGLGFGTYEVEVTQAILGKVHKTIKLPGQPSVMREGRTYVLFLEKQQHANDAASLGLAESYYRSVFEINDCGDVLPIREYGMKAPVRLEKFLKGLR